MTTLRLLGLASLLAMVCPAPARAQCPDQTFDVFERQGYTVRAVQVSGPLLNASALRDEVLAPFVKAGAPVAAAAIEAGKTALRELFQRTPSLFDSPLAATVIQPVVDACDEGTKTLDVRYRVFTTKLPLQLSRTFESRDQEARDPAARLAMARTPVRFRVTPLIRYSALEHVVAGGRLMATLPGTARLDAEVTASDTVLNADIDFTGEYEREAAFLRRLEWRGGYHRHDRPTDDDEVHEQKFAAQVTALSRPLGAAGAILRAATSLEGGRTESDLAAGDLPAGFVPDASYGSWNTAAGVTVRLRRHAFSASYGLQLGFTSGSGGFDFTKSVGEAAYEGRFAINGLPHHAVDLVSRAGFGRLSGDDGVPAGARFFGGAGAIPFLGLEAWALRANPELRSFPAFSFDDPGTGVAAGGDYFLSYNFTGSFPVWVRPLVPRDVTDDAVVRQGIEGMLGSGESILETSYKIDDPAHQRALTASQRLKPILESIEARVAELLPGMAEPAKEAAQSCVDQVQVLMDVVDAISPRTYLGSLLSQPVDEGDATLPSVVRACVDDLGTEVRDTTLAQQGSELAAVRTAVADQIAQIDSAAARGLAARDMRFARDSVATILDDLNAIEIGPVFVFDVARLGQHHQPQADAVRYGIGTGIRVSLASAFHLSAGYVWNPKRQHDERPGAAFVAFELTTLFGR